MSSRAQYEGRSRGICHLLTRPTLAPTVRFRQIPRLPVVARDDSWDCLSLLGPFLVDSRYDTTFQVLCLPVRFHHQNIAGDVVWPGIQEPLAIRGDGHAGQGPGHVTAECRQRIDDSGG